MGKKEDLHMANELSGAVKEALIRELEELRDEVKTLAEALDEAAFWKKPLEPGNVGHLVLHLTGNLNYLVGGLQLGGTGYVPRTRPGVHRTNPAAKKGGPCRPRRGRRCLSAGCDRLEH